MSETKFTPGPWLVDEIHGDVGIYCDDSLGRIVAKAGSFQYVPRGDEEVRANAYLISAAPELYEALKGAMETLEAIEDKTLVGHEGCLWPVEIARAAIAKAEGRES